MQHNKSLVGVALDQHTLPSQDGTRRSLSDWLGRDISPWVVELLLQLRGTSMTEEDISAISEMVDTPEDAADAVKLHKVGPFQTLYFDNTASGSYEWTELRHFADRPVYVTVDGVSASTAHNVWDQNKDTLIINTSEQLAERLSDTFGWEVV
jgi:hypothetical protein